MFFNKKVAQKLFIRRHSSPPFHNYIVLIFKWSQKRTITKSTSQYSNVYETLKFSSKTAEKRNSNLYTNQIKLVESEMSHLTHNIRKLFDSCHPILHEVANYYIQTQGKHVRPLIVLLISKAANLSPKIKNWNDQIRHKYNDPISSTTIVNDNDPDQPLSSYPIAMDLTETLRQLFELNLNTLCDTHDTFKCKRCKNDKQFVKTSALLYGDVSTWNHFSQFSLEKINDFLLQQEKEHHIVSFVFQYLIKPIKLVIQDFMDAMDTELSSTTLKNSFSTVPMDSFNSIDESNKDLNIQYNLLKNLFESVHGQEDSSGPASTLLKTMHLSLPSDPSMTFNSSSMSSS
ncbi:hypothetical protein PCK1_002894 [Pneumocystis canis]|nr:hypothetical protein PCK1_002894 [Pneumocystis canis]